VKINGDYPHPVTVNGFSCKNCTEVDLARKHINPAHPKSGPYGENAANDPTVKQKPAVTFGGALRGLNAAAGATLAPGGASTGTSPGGAGTPASSLFGTLVDLTASGTLSGAAGAPPSSLSGTLVDLTA
jgi:hypothetical protein